MYEPDWDEWWEIAESSQSSTFFHSPIWGELATVRGYDPSPLTVSSGDNRWLFPAVKRHETYEKLGITKTITIMESMFAGTYGGWISPNQTQLKDGNLCEKLEQKADIILTAGNPISDSEPINWIEQEDFTQILNLSPGYSELKDGFSDGRQWGINSAREKGVSIREATDREDWEGYYQAYQASLERWDEPSSVYSWEFFERAFELSKEYPRNIRLWLAEIGDNIGSGALVFYWNQHADYWHAASHEEYFDYQPNDLLQAEIIKDASERGYQWYDFNPSGGHKGVVNFKREFGPEKRTISRWKYKDTKLQLASSMLDKLGI